MGPEIVTVFTMGIQIPNVFFLFLFFFSDVCVAENTLPLPREFTSPLTRGERNFF